MWIKIMRDTVADGKPVKQGDVLKVSDANARTLVLMGKAVDVLEPKEKPAINGEVKVAQAPAPEDAIEGAEDDLGVEDPDLAPGTDEAPAPAAKKVKKQPKKRKW